MKLSPMKTNSPTAIHPEASGLALRPDQESRQAARPGPALPVAEKRVLLISYWYPPNMEMGSRTCEQIARYLPLSGWQPLALTIREELIEAQYLSRSPRTDQSAPHTIIRTGRLPHPLDLYRWFKAPAADVRAAVAAGSSTGREKGRLRELLLAWLSIPDLYTGWLIPAIASGWRAIRRDQVQALMSSGPCWTNHLVAYGLSWLTGLPWLVHFRDPWATGFMPGAYRFGFEIRVNRWLERATLARASRVVCVTEEHTALLRRTWPELPAEKFETVLNGYDGADWQESDQQIRPTQTGRSEKFRVTYAGSLYIGRNPLPVLRALRQLIEAGEVRREVVEFNLIGWCETSQGQSIADLIAETGLQDCVNLTGPLAHAVTLRHLAQADLLLLLAEGLEIQIPGKTFEYLRAGRPILALTSEGAVSRLIERTQSGWAVDPADESGILLALRECYQQWMTGASARIPDPAMVATYDRRLTTSQLGKILDELTAQPALQTALST